MARASASVGILKQLKGDFPEKVLPPHAAAVEDFAVAFLVRLPSWKTLHVRWPLQKKLVFASSLQSGLGKSAF